MILSVVIIGKNEEKNIQRCMESVVKAVADIESCEIVYVDSASTDRTVEIVKNYSVRIIQLRPEWQLTSSAGRYLGFKNTTGKYIFFVDGDTVVYKDWPEQAMQYLDSSENTGGVAGIVHEIFLDERGNRISVKKNRYNISETGEVKVFGGIAMYKRHVLNKAGALNPYVKATPEHEMALRIRKEGYRLIRIDKQMAITYAPERDTIKEVVRRAKTNLYSMGSTLRVCKKNGLACQYIKERMGFIANFGILVLLVFSGIITSLILKRTDIFLAVIAVIVGVLILLAVKKRSISKPLFSLIKRSVILYCTIKSLFGGSLKKPSEYPEDVIVIKK